MPAHQARFGPLGAFVLTLAATALYFVCLAALVAASSHELPGAPGFVLFVVAPVILCGPLYAVNARDESAMPVQWVRTIAASILAPCIVAAVYVTVGFTLLGWSR